MPQCLSYRCPFTLWLLRQMEMVCLKAGVNAQRRACGAWGAKALGRDRISVQRGTAPQWPTPAEQAWWQQPHLARSPMTIRQAHRDEPGLRPTRKSSQQVRISRVHSQAQTPFQPTPDEDGGQGQLCAWLPSGEAPAGFSQLSGTQLCPQHSDPRLHSTILGQTLNTSSQTCRTGGRGYRVS